MPIIQLPDGQKVSFPDNATPEMKSAFKAKLAQKYGQPNAPQQQAAPQSAQMQPAASAQPQGNLISDVGAGLTRGVQQLGLGATQLGAEAYNALGGENQQFRNYLEQEAQRLKPQANTPTINKISAATPETIAMLSPMGAAGLGAKVGISAGKSAAASALQPTTADESRINNTLTGAAGGALGEVGGAAIGRVLNPQTREAAKKLLAENIPLTAGQILGGTAQKIEDSATSGLLTGGLITGAKRRSIEAFARSRVNDSLSKIGEKLPDEIPMGREAIDYAQRKISDAYNVLLPKLSGKVDDAFSKDAIKIFNEFKGVPEEKKAQLAEIIKDSILGSIDDVGKIDGKTLKGIETRLGDLGRRYSKSSVTDEVLLGQQIGKIQNSFREMLYRQNPTQRKALMDVNRAFALQERNNAAAASVGAVDGVFTPAQYSQAVRKGDSTRGKRAFAAGKAFGQDMADTAKSVLPSTIPDSGTASRLILQGALGAGIGGAAGSGYISPEYLIPAALIGGAYTPIGQKAMTAALTKRPDAVRKLGNVLRRYGGAVGGEATRINTQTENK